MGPIETTQRKSAKRAHKAIFEPASAMQMATLRQPKPVTYRYVYKQCNLNADWVLAMRCNQVKIIRINDIQKAVCKYFGLSKLELLGNRRSDSIVRPRQIAMYLCKQLTSNSYPEIGRRFNKDHSTVIHACRRVSELIERDPQFAITVRAVENSIR